MELSEYAKLAAFENRYWWHVGRRSIVARQIAKLHRQRHDLHILNVGSGTGGTVKVLAEHGNVLNIDQSQEAVRLIQESGYEALQMDGANTDLPNEQFDLVAALDVLEHIREDESALQEWGRLLKPGGYLLLTVPAYQWLWSGHDVSLGHFRRYSASGLEQKVRAAGFEMCKRSYAITFSFPLIVAFRLLQKLLRPSVRQTSYVRLPALLNSLFIGLLRVESYLLQALNLPFGTSVLVVARKPAAAIVPRPTPILQTKLRTYAAAQGQSR